jgi:chromosome partitioning protein
VDLLLVDGPAKADAETLALARTADLIVQPCGGGLDDLRPAIRTFNGLIDRGVPRSRLLMALVRVGSEAEAGNARDYLEVAGYACASGWLPERLTYRTLHNAGQSITEAKIPGLRAAAEVLVQSIIDTAQAAQEAT